MLLKNTRRFAYNQYFPTEFLPQDTCRNFPVNRVRSASQHDLGRRIFWFIWIITDFDSVGPRIFTMGLLTTTIERIRVTISQTFQLRYRCFFWSFDTRADGWCSWV